jgi:hypothetical protein
MPIGDYTNTGVPTTKERKKMAAKEYYTAKEAAEVLGKPLTSFYRDVREGRIPFKGKRPNMQFPVEAIDAIAEVETKKDHSGLMFVKSTTADAWKKQEIVKELLKKGSGPYDEDILIPFKTIVEWRKRNNDTGMHVEENGTILGWSSLFPMEENIIKAVINGEIEEKDIPAESIKRWTDKNLSVYISVVEVVPTENKERDKIIGEFLIRNTIRWAISLMIEYDIKNWYGLATSEEGEILMKKLGFKNMNGAGKYNGYVLESNAATAKAVARILERIEKNDEKVL